MNKDILKSSGGNMPNSKELVNDDIEVQDSASRFKSIEFRLLSIEELIRQNNLLLRILAQPVLLNSLQGTFKDAKQLRAYELSDGERSTRDIGKLVKRDQKGISNWWREWEKLGIAEKVGRKGQFKARYTLVELLYVIASNKSR